MIAADTSSLSAYLTGEKGDDVSAVEDALQARHLVLPPVVLTELLSEPKLPQVVVQSLRHVPLLDILEGYWERAGHLRAKILRAGYKSRLPDLLIAQSCIDHHLLLITRDPDFRHHVRFGGLKILSAS